MEIEPQFATSRMRSPSGENDVNDHLSGRRSRECQHRLDVISELLMARDLAGGASAAQRLRVRALASDSAQFLLQFREQPHVLGGDHRLGGEICVASCWSERAGVRK
jgi:hypothetical protein